MLLLIILHWFVMGTEMLPQGGEPYTWRRPVPSWHQSEETVTLENKGFHFEVAEFEVHFRDQGALVSKVD